MRLRRKRDPANRALSDSLSRDTRDGKIRQERNYVRRGALDARPSPSFCWVLQREKMHNAAGPRGGGNFRTMDNGRHNVRPKGVREKRKKLEHPASARRNTARYYRARAITLAA